MVVMPSTLINSEVGNRSCGVCHGVVWKYRCPKCKILYCSVKCYKDHKAIGCGENIFEEDLKSADIKVLSYSFPSEDTIPLNVLQNLGDSEELKEMLMDLDLRQIILAVDSSNEPDELLKEAMKQSIFYECVTKCLEIVQKEDS